MTSAMQLTVADYAEAFQCDKITSVIIKTNFTATEMFLTQIWVFSVVTARLCSPEHRLSTLPCVYQFYGAPDLYEAMLKYLNIVFTALFTLECILKIIAFGPLVRPQRWLSTVLTVTLKKITRTIWINRSVSGLSLKIGGDYSQNQNWKFCELNQNLVE